jgi:hypothetical protein
MKKFISYPSTPQFREIVGNVNRHNNFVGLDENGDAIYDQSKPKPIIKFIGTVKLHGTNASVMYNDESGIWVQSRSNIITPEKDNAGFAWFVESKKKFFQKLFNQIKEKYSINTTLNTIGIYSEWAGANIQKGVGICNIEKSCFIYGIKISPITEIEEEQKNNSAYWVDYYGFKDKENKIYNMLDFKTYEIDVDFNRPELSQNKIVEMTLEVENECPVAKEFGFLNTIGEGIVFTNIKDGVRIFFKSKGEAHSATSKVKTLKVVDDEKINKCIEISEKVTPSWRLNQMVDETFDTINGGQLDVKQMGSFIKAVINDVIKEDSDIISDAGLEIKEIAKYISEISRKFFFQRLNEDIGLK